MNRRTFLLGAPALAACGDRRRRLNVLNFSDYIAPDTIPNFEAETGTRVRYTVAETNEEILARVMNGNSGWDVIFITHNRIGPVRDLGLLARIDRRRLSNLDNLSAEFRSPPWDRALDWGVPYMWQSSGIYFNRKLAPAPPARWADLWDERLAGRLTMLDDPEDVFGACMKKLGFSYVSSDPNHLRQARDEALRQKRLVRAYLNTEVRDQVVAGDVVEAQALSSTAAQAMVVSGNVGFAYPEGFGIYADNAVILRESRRSELAHEFINYLLRPAVAVAIVATAKTATANGRAQSMLPAVLRDNPALYPPPDVFQRGEWAATLPPATQRLRDRLWTEIKSA
jgi:spermidine/putrescine transport system substrate-binding protein